MDLDVIQLSFVSNGAWMCGSGTLGKHSRCRYFLRCFLARLHCSSSPGVGEIGRAMLQSLLPCLNITDYM